MRAIGNGSFVTDPKKDTFRKVAWFGANLRSDWWFKTFVDCHSWVKGKAGTRITREARRTGIW